MIQGDVCWHTFKEPDKRRPVLILTRNGAIPVLDNVTVAQISTTIRNLKSFVRLDETDGMNEQCAINLDNIQTIQKDKLSQPITHLSAEKMREVK